MIPVPVDVPGVQRNHQTEVVQEALLREESGADCPPTAPAASAVELNRLRAAVDEMRKERDQLRSEIAVHRAEEREPVSTVVDTGEVRREHIVRREPIQSPGMINRRSKYGLRGVRVGEADHLGPRRRVVASSSRSESDSGVRNVFPRLTQLDSDEDIPLLQVGSPIPIGRRFCEV